MRASSLYLVIALAAAVSPSIALARSDMYIVAHEDDDLLFMNPDIAQGIAVGNSVTSVYVTAGNSNALLSDGSYDPSTDGTNTEWMEREKGILNAYADMAVRAGALPSTTPLSSTSSDIQCNQTGSVLANWALATVQPVATSEGHTISYVQYSLTGTNINVVFLRITDSSLKDLWFQTNGVVNTPTVPATSDYCDEQCTWSCTAPGNCSGHLNCALHSYLAQQHYTRRDLIDVLLALMDRHRPNSINILDSAGWYAQHYYPEEGCAEIPSAAGPYWCDNSSHVMASLFAFAAQQRYSTPHFVAMYRGYDVKNEARNLAPEEQSPKTDYFADYSISYEEVCTSTTDTSTTCSFDEFGYTEYLKRKYVVREIRDTVTLSGALESDGKTSSGDAACLVNSGSGVVFDSCEAPVGSGTISQGASWILDFSGFLKNQGQCLQAHSDHSVGMTTCPVTPDQSTRWVLFSNGELRGGANGDALTYNPATRALQTTTLAQADGGVPPQYYQKWGLQFGSVGRWSQGTDFTDAELPTTTNDSSYRTFQLADYNGDGLADACIRLSSGIWCAQNNGLGSFDAWAQTPQGGWSDASGWGVSQYGSTIVLGHPNGLGSVFACGSGAFGYDCGDMSTSSISIWTPEFSGQAGYSSSDVYYGTIRLADVNGDGRDEVCGRGSGGVFCQLSNGAGQFVTYTTAEGGFSDSASWNQEIYATSIQFGDINGDGLADVCGRGAAGVWCATSTASGFTKFKLWSWQGPGTSCTSNGACSYVNSDYGNNGDSVDGTPWSSNSSYYRSFRLVDVNRDGMADLCARGKYGLVCALSDGTSFAPARHFMDREFTDAKGWGTDRYGSSITFGVLTGDKGVGVCGRGVSVQCSSIGGN